jgi:hypothetical protein
MSRLGTQSEIDKLVVTLGLEPGTLGFLVDLPPEELRNLRIAIYERLFQQDSVVFERIAMLAVRTPAPVAAQMAQRLGPMISARVAAELPTEVALAIVRRIPVGFFADATEYLDPRRVRELIARIPVSTIVAVAVELVRRGRFQTISRFVDFVSDEQTRAVVDAIEDEAAILRVAFYMGSKNRMDHLFRTLSDERLERLVVRVERERDELLPAFLSVLIHVSYALKRRLADLVASQEDSVLGGYVRATQSQGLWSDVLPVVAGMSPEARRKVVNLPILSEREVQTSIVETADQHHLWGLVLPLVGEMDDANRDAVAEIVAARDGATLELACEAALMGEQWETLLDLGRRLPERKRAELAEIITGLLADADPELLERLAQRAAEVGLGYLTSESRTGVSASSA